VSAAGVVRTRSRRSPVGPAGLSPGAPVT